MLIGQMAIDTIQIYSRRYFAIRDKEIHITFLLDKLSENALDVLNIGIDALIQDTGIYIDEFVDDSMAVYCIDTEDAHIDSFGELSSFVVCQYTMFFSAVNNEMRDRGEECYMSAIISVVRDGVSYPIHEFGKPAGLSNRDNMIGTYDGLVSAFYRFI